MFITIEISILFALGGFILGWIGCEAYQFYKIERKWRGSNGSTKR